MREFETTFKEGLRGGLRKGFDNSRNSEALTEAFNLKCYENGIRPFIPITWVSGWSLDWPYPQAFVGKNYRVLATRNRTYEIASDFDLVKALDVPEGQRWDFIDFGDYLLLVNGSTIVVNYNGSYSKESSTSIMPRFATGCNFRGQIVAGDIRTDWFDCDRGSVIWSKIGSADFTPGGGSIAGYRHIYWEDNVLRTIRLGDAVVVYGSNGIMSMIPSDATFGMKEILDVGIPTRDSVAGDDKFHFFVDSDRWLWIMGVDLKPKKLGYQEYIETLNDNFIMSYDSFNKDLYISDNSNCFLLTPYGMTKVHQLITSVVNIGGTSYGSISEGSNQDIILVTDTIDFGIRGIKTISTVELGVDCSSNVFIAIDYRYNKANGFSRSPWKLTGPEGVGTPIVSAPEMRVCVKTTPLVSDKMSMEDGIDMDYEDGTSMLYESGITFDDFNLDYINTKVKLVDRRFIRGPRTSDIRHNTE